jgi:hypothetical protein
VLLILSLTTVEPSVISYDKRELLRLVHAHLLSSGLLRTAQVLLLDFLKKKLKKLGTAGGRASQGAPGRLAQKENIKNILKNKKTIRYCWTKGA